MQTPTWKHWDATDPNRIVPFERTISIFRDAHTGTRYGIQFGNLLPVDYHVRETGQIDVKIPGSEVQSNPVFTNWITAHTLFGVVSFCIRHGLPRPQEEWAKILPKWVDDLFVFHEGKKIPSGYLAYPNFNYFNLSEH